MVDIERNASLSPTSMSPALPIVMNTAEQIPADMAADDVRTPFLIGDGTVSQAHGTLGKGMRACLPGDSFVLTDIAHIDFTRRVARLVPGPGG